MSPEFFKDDRCCELSLGARLMFLAVLMMADREGRLEDRINRIVITAFPYEFDSFGDEAEEMLDELLSFGFVDRYEVGGASYLQVCEFLKFQSPTGKERPSKIPPPPGHADSGYNAASPSASVRRLILERDGYRCRHCGRTHKLSIDHITPRKLGGPSDETNLQVLCRPCNARKGARMPEETA